MTALSEIRKNWLLLVAALLGSALINIPTYGLGIFMPIWEQEFQWTRSEIGLAMSFFIAVVVITSPLAGWVVDRFGARRPILLTALTLPIGLLLISRVGPEIWTLYAAYAAWGALGALGTMVSYSRSVAQYFDAGRGLAFGITTSSSSVALLATPLIFAALLGIMDWRHAWMASAAIPLLLFPLLYKGIRDTPTLAQLRRGEAPTTAAPGLRFRQALRSYRFWVIGAAFLLASFAVAGAVFQMLPVLRDRGLSLQEAIATQAMLGIGLAGGRLACGYIIDHVFAPAVFGAVMISAALGFVGLAAGPIEAGVVYMFFIGVALGAEGDILAYFCTRYFGLREYAKLYGCLFGLMNCGAMLTPIVFGYLYDIQGSYTSALWVAVAALLVSTGLVATLGRYPRLEDNAIPLSTSGVRQPAS